MSTKCVKKEVVTLYEWILESEVKDLANEIRIRDKVIDEIIAQFDYSHDLKWRKEFKESIFELVIKENKK